MNKVFGTKIFKIVEIFTSIQGESSHSGKLCFFIRFAGCNLNCSYCDTEYAKYPLKIKEISLEELINYSEKSGVKTIAITGGEPLLQKNLPELCKRLLERKFSVLVETNGSLLINILPEKIIKIVDCKCPSSGEAGKMDFKNFDLLKPYDEIKFVIKNKKDYNYAKKIIKKFKIFDKTQNILFSPVTWKIKASKLAGWIIKDKLNIRLNLQIHKYLWPDKNRGV